LRTIMPAVLVLTIGALSAGCQPKDPAKAARDFVKQGRCGDAVLQFDRAIAADPVNIGLWTERGAAKMRTSDFAGAAADFGRAIELYPDDPWAWYARGGAHWRAKDLNAALLDAEALLALRPGSEQGWLLRGRVRLDKKDFAGAVEDLQRLVAPGADAVDRVDFLRRDEISTAHYQHAVAIAGRDGPAAGIAAIDAALQRGLPDMDKWMLYRERARLDRSLGDRQAAASDEAKAAAAMPRFDADIVLSQARPARSAQQVREDKENRQRLMDAAQAADAAIKRGDHQDALRYYDEELRAFSHFEAQSRGSWEGERAFNTTRASILLSKANSQFALGQMDEAAKTARESVGSDPRCQEGMAHYIIGTIAASKGNERGYREQLDFLWLNSREMAATLQKYGGAALEAAKRGDRVILKPMPIKDLSRNIPGGPGAPSPQDSR
jgi:tetratricopeptide (TPR) repeat protein